MLGLPTECLHHNKIRQCRLSFSCWLQGGKHAQGCGDNRWLFSCCITDKDATAGLRTPISTATSGGMAASSSTTATSDSFAAGSAPVVYVAASNTPAAIIKGVVVRKPTAAGFGSHKPKLTRPALRTKAPPSGGHGKHAQKLNGNAHKYGASKKNILRRRTDDGVVQTHGTPQPPPVECGIARTAQNTLQKRIIGGRIARFAEYPWQAHIRIAEFQCGGVLVARQFIATAAHCIQQARVKDIVVYLGELDTQNAGAAVEPLPAEKHRVIKKLVHPRFQFRVTQPDRYDLALLQLASPTAYK